MIESENYFGLAALSALLLLGTLASGVSHSQTLAFPSAEGFGRFATGGRGGTVYKVTNLNNSGAGSLRACFDASGPRTCIFDVSGIINLSSRLDARNGNMTVAGQTAPGDGIQIKGAPVYVRGSHHIIRHMRFRPGINNSQGSYGAAFTANDADNVIVDHVSTSWFTDENVNIWNAQDTTYQWMIISEPIHCSGRGQWGNCSGKCLLQGNGSTRNSILNSAFIHCWDRAPLVYSGDFELVNNVIYNYFNTGWNASTFYPLGTNSEYPTNTRIRANIVGNLWIRGPDTDLLNSSSKPLHLGNGAGLYSSSQYYLNDNIDAVFRSSNNLSQSAIVHGGTDRIVSTPLQFAYPVSNALEANAAKGPILAAAGATVPIRDSVDTRVVADVIAGTGGYVCPPGTPTPHSENCSGENEVGGFPTIALVTRPAGFDTDNDGIPNTWESEHGLNPNNAADGAAFHSNGYTNLENYLNVMAGDVVPGISGSDVTPPAAPNNVNTIPPS